MPVGALTRLIADRLKLQGRICEERSIESIESHRKKGHDVFASNLETYARAPQSTTYHQRDQEHARHFRPSQAPRTRHGLLLMLALLEARGGGCGVGGFLSHGSLHRVILFRLGLVKCKRSLQISRSMQHSIPRVGLCLAPLLPPPPPQFLALCDCVEGLCPMTLWQDRTTCRCAEV